MQGTVLVSLIAKDVIAYIVAITVMLRRQAPPSPNGVAFRILVAVLRPTWLVLSA